MRSTIAFLMFLAIGLCPQQASACNKNSFESMVLGGESAERIVSTCREYLLDPATNRSRTLAWVVRMGQLPFARELMKLGYQPEPDSIDGLLFDALAAQKDPYEMVEFLVSYGADIERAQQKFDLIYHAIEQGYSRTLQALVARLGDRETLYAPHNLFAATAADNVALVEAILDRHGDANFTEGDDKVTPLMVAAERGVSDEMIRTLIMRGADCARSNRVGNTAVALASSERVSNVLRHECRRP
jgi:ankyrin repeat protein